MKNADFKIWSILTQTVGLPLGKKSIFGRKTNILLKASNRVESVHPKKRPLRHVVGLPMTKDKEIVQKRWSQDKGKTEISFNSLPGRYLHFKMIPKEVV